MSEANFEAVGGSRTNLIAGSVNGLHRRSSTPVENGHLSQGQELQESYHHVFDLTKSLSHCETEDKDETSKLSARRNLDWFGGVLAAVALAQFSTCLFLRVGEWI